MVRIFVALELPLEVKEKLLAINDNLSKTSARLNLVNPEISHITLKFIGEVNEKKLNEIINSLSKLHFSRYNINLKGVSLNSTKTPRIIWINGYDNGESSKLAGIIEDLLIPFGIDKEKRPFKIHATIARIKSWHPSIIPVVKSFETETFGEFEIAGFKLKKSLLTPNGPIYEDIMEVSF